MANLHFDTALPRLIEIVNKHLFSAGVDPKVDGVCVVRDLKGCLRLVVSTKEEAKRGEIPIFLLEKELRERLKGWFQPPVLTTCSDEPAARKNTAKILLEKARVQKIPWPSHWPTEITDELGARKAIDPMRWCSLQRVQSKETWLSRRSGEPPWGLERGEPAIVSFYSFKGGVGRTTCMGIAAYQLAKRGKKVVCVDLDLEAPGLADVLGLRTPELGLMDFLLSSLAGDGRASLDISEIGVEAHLHGVPLWVVPSGRMDVYYVEKLARLDYLAGTDLAEETQSPVALGMRNLLNAAKGKFKPDYIFLDCRAGFHDLGGLGLHDLAHVEVIVGRASRQTLHGLDVILALQKLRRKEEERRLCVVHTFASADPRELGGQHNRWRRELYELFEKHGLFRFEEKPQEEDDQAVHFPWTIAHEQRIEYAASLADEGLQAVLDDPRSGFTSLVKRIEELCSPEEPIAAGSG